MPKFADYTKFAASYCPNLPAFIFERAMLSAAREYFTSTQSWQEDIEIELTQGNFEYPIPFPWEAAMIGNVLNVTIDGKSLTGLGVKLKPEYEQTPKYFSLIGKETIQFMPIPSQAKTAVITVILKPSIQTNSMPKDVLDEHFEGLLAGTIWEIKRIAGDWYNPQESLDFRAQFEAFIDLKRIEMARGNSNNELRIQMEPFL